MHVLWCETVLQLLRHYLKPVASFTTYNHFVHVHVRVEMDPLFKERMTAIATAKAASTKSCVLSQERFDAIVHDLSSSQDKVDRLDPHFKHWVKSKNFQLVDLPGLFKLLVIPIEREQQGLYNTVPDTCT